MIQSRRKFRRRLYRKNNSNGEEWKCEWTREWGNLEGSQIGIKTRRNANITRTPRTLKLSIGSRLPFARFVLVPSSLLLCLFSRDGSVFLFCVRRVALAAAGAGVVVATSAATDTAALRATVKSVVLRLVLSSSGTVASLRVQVLFWFETTAAAAATAVSLMRRMDDRSLMKCCIHTVLLSIVDKK